MELPLLPAYYAEKEGSKEREKERDDIKEKGQTNTQTMRSAALYDVAFLHSQHGGRIHAEGTYVSIYAGLKASIPRPPSISSRRRRSSSTRSRLIIVVGQ